MDPEFLPGEANRHSPDFFASRSSIGHEYSVAISTVKQVKNRLPSVRTFDSECLDLVSTLINLLPPSFAHRKEEWKTLRLAPHEIRFSGVLAFLDSLEQGLEEELSMRVPKTDMYSPESAALHQKNLADSLDALDGAIWGT
ncbi:MAG: hypothetical protein WC777_00480 [Candidatus Gracilibacteria bacterium]